MFDNRISTLSGGEKRRLYLITVLMQQPNLLILDEPTNDLDIVTLGILEEYLLEFKGSLVIVSHDRHFLDRLVDHLFIFTGDGEIKDFVGDYSTWREYVRAAEGKDKEASKQPAKDAPARKQREKKDKLSWKEQRELESLETAIDALEKEKASLEAILSGGGGGDAVTEASRRYGELQNELDEKELRWLELSEKL
jgi:ATP-binding cassette subfamily F protein uup